LKLYYIRYIQLRYGPAALSVNIQEIGHIQNIQ